MFLSVYLVKFYTNAQRKWHDKFILKVFKTRKTYIGIGLIGLCVVSY